MARTKLFKRLPEAWKRYDVDHVAERYLGVLDEGLDASHDLARQVLGFRSIDEVPDRFLPLAGELVGHEWRSDKDHDWNRSRIRDAIRRYSYKSTTECIRDLVREHGGGPCNIIDMASKLIVLDLQGDLGTDNAHFEGDDYYHTGAFVLEITNQVNLVELKKDMANVTPGGTRWYYRLMLEGKATNRIAGNSQCSSVIESTNTNRFSLDVGLLDESLWLDFPASGQSMSTSSVSLTGAFGGLVTMASVGFKMSDTQMKMSAGGPGCPLPIDLALRCGTSEIS
jgi:hypothetical protein